MVSMYCSTGPVFSRQDWPNSTAEAVTSAIQPSGLVSASALGMPHR
jgi:hypothetical protein